MSRGTTLTLYKKYNIQMDEKSFNKIVDKYVEYNKENDWCVDKKIASEYRNDLPLILNKNAFRTTSKYNKRLKKWIETPLPNTIERMKNDAFGYVDKCDKLCCEKIMEWDFGSTFDCLIDHLNIGYCNFSKSSVFITEEMASKMLSAIDYILGGEWSDKIERSMDNPYIKIFTDGYRGDAYWKYVHRNSAKRCKKISFKDSGYEITIKCPTIPTEDDLIMQSECSESNECIEYALSTFRSGLIAFLKSDNWERDNSSGWIHEKYKYVLTYEYWG